MWISHGKFWFTISWLNHHFTKFDSWTIKLRNLPCLSLLLHQSLHLFLCLLCGPDLWSQMPDARDLDQGLAWNTGGFHRHGTPKSSKSRGIFHGIFPWNQPSSELGVPPWRAGNPHFSIPNDSKGHIWYSQLPWSNLVPWMVVGLMNRSVPV